MNLEVAIQNMIDRGLLEKLTEDPGTQSAKFEGGFSGTMDDVERLQNYGFTSVPGPGAQLLYVCLGGSQEFPVILTADHPDLRKQIGEWESALWTKFGNYVHLKADGSLEISSKEEGLTVTLKADGKMTIKNKQGELISLLSQLVELLSTAVVSTAIGPQPLSTKPQLTELKAKIDSFKG